MLSPLIEQAPVALMVTSFGASVVGSLHCVGMCGPFVAVYAAGTAPTEENSPRHPLLWAHLGYHGGRAATYVTLGALGGAAGAAVDWAGEGAGLVHLAALVSGLVVVLWGLGVLYPRLRIRSPLDGFLSARLVKLRTKPRVVRASVLGLLTPVLPCGWLYAFVVSAAGTGSALSGASVMFAFWLGTVPALLGASVVFAKLGQALRAKVPLLLGVALIVVGLTGVVTRSQKPLPTAPRSSAPTSATATVPTEAPCH